MGLTRCYKPAVFLHEYSCNAHLAVR